MRLRTSTNALFAVLAALLSLSACSEDETAAASAGTSSGTGTVSLTLDLPEAVELDTVDFSIKAGDFAEVNGQFTVGSVSGGTLTTVLNPVPAGFARTISLTATASNGAFCQGVVTIDVVPNGTSDAQLTFTCTGGTTPPTMTAQGAAGTAGMLASGESPASPDEDSSPMIGTDASSTGSGDGASEAENGTEDAEAPASPDEPSAGETSEDGMMPNMMGPAAGDDADPEPTDMSATDGSDDMAMPPGEEPADEDGEPTSPDEMPPVSGEDDGTMGMPSTGEEGEMNGQMNGEMMEPAPTDPSPTDPSPTDPSPTDPSPTDPSPTDPSPAEPEPAEPEPAEPEPEPTDMMAPASLIGAWISPVLVFETTIDPNLPLLLQAGPATIRQTMIARIDADGVATSQICSLEFEETVVGIDFISDVTLIKSEPTQLVTTDVAIGAAFPVRRVALSGPDMVVEASALGGAMLDVDVTVDVTLDGTVIDETTVTGTASFTSVSSSIAQVTIPASGPAPSTGFTITKVSDDPTISCQEAAALLP